MAQQTQLEGEQNGGFIGRKEVGLQPSTVPDISLIRRGRHARAPLQSQHAAAAFLMSPHHVTERAAMWPEATWGQDSTLLRNMRAEVHAHRSGQVSPL